MTLQITVMEIGLAVVGMARSTYYHHLKNPSKKKPERMKYLLEKLTADVTRLKVDDEKLYPSPVIDLYKREKE